MKPELRVIQGGGGFESLTHEITRDQLVDYTKKLSVVHRFASINFGDSDYPAARDLLEVTGLEEGTWMRELTLEEQREVQAHTDSWETEYKASFGEV